MKKLHQLVNLLWFIQFLPVLEAQSNSNCGAFTVQQSINSDTLCTLHDLSVPSQGETFYLNWLVPSYGAATFRKVCLTNIPTQCSNTSKWHFDQAPGWVLRMEQSTRIQHVFSMEMCMELCARENAFKCRSATYSARDRNCHLSRSDRRTAPLAFQAGTPQDIYLENQCVDNVREGCDFNEVRGLATALYSWKIVQPVDSETQCESACTTTTDFVCRGYKFTANQCKLSSDDAFSMRPLHDNGTAESYKQIGQCVHATVQCTMERMLATFESNRELTGKLFATGAANTCSFQIEKKFRITLSLSLQTPDICAIQEDTSQNKFSTMFMLQYNPMVKTGMDRMFQLMCMFVTRDQLVTREVDLVNPTPSPTTIVVTGGGPLPSAQMRIVNGQGQTITTAELDQTLYAEVILVAPPEGDEYGIFVTDCDAQSSSGAVVLIDSSGCPTDTNIFEGFSPVPGTNDKVIRAAFGSFSFEAQNKVNVNCNVAFCYKFCEPALCTDKNGLRIQSYGKKRKRRSAPESLIIQPQRDLLSWIRVGSDFVVNIPPPSLLANVSYEKASSDSYLSKAIATGLCLGIIAFVGIGFTAFLWHLSSRKRTIKVNVSLSSDNKSS